MQRDTIGRYRLVKRLSAGSTADVHLALLRSSLPGFEKACALKVVHAEISALPDFAEHLRAEAQLALALSHPNVVSVHEIGADDGRWFLAMELVEGCDLALLGKTCWGRHHPPPLLASLFIAHEVLRGLAYCHRRAGDASEVHRSLSGANVLISFDGAVKLADFGLSISPERQLRRPTDLRSDLFCIGTLLFELIVGQPLPPGASPADVLAALSQTTQPGLPPLPGPVRALLLRALADDPESSFQSATEFGAAVQQLIIERDPTYGAPQLAALMEQLFAALVGEEQVAAPARAVPEPRHAGSRRKRPTGRAQAVKSTDPAARARTTPDRRPSNTTGVQPKRGLFGQDLSTLETVIGPSPAQPQGVHDQPTVIGRRLAEQQTILEEGGLKVTVVTQSLEITTGELILDDVDAPPPPPRRRPPPLPPRSRKSKAPPKPPGSPAAAAGGERPGQTVATSAYVVGPDGKLRRIRLIHGS